MSDSMEKKLVNAFAEAWGEAAPALLGRPSELGLLALREVRSEDMESALAVAVTWSSAFAAACSGAMPGVFVCLFKGEDSDEIEKLAKRETDGRPKPGGRAVVTAALQGVAARLGADAPVFAEITWLDLAADVSRLARVAGDSAWIGTCSLTLGDEMTQALLLYAPNGSMEAVRVKNQAAATASATATAAAVPSPQPAPSRRAPRQPEAPRNIERLLDVELEIIVRFGLTSLPLREIVRMGVGTMIELDRAVDEPVELLVNGRPLARGNVVVIDGYYGVRITEIGEPSQRPVSLV
ncbi:MAG TPA: FliM/FliN family flagellar motor switch protein [Blastocatellia bacterium]|nr:FliM/FliN family flagellar motor switch protein [Blastocatellia bacterium]